jgi:YesN/AraC family two-component response regulator
MKPKSILLVDDEQIILSSLSRELTSDHLNFKVKVAGNGELAIAMINEEFFDLVLTDLVMPGLDGFQVLKAAKRKDALTKVIILTGYADLQSAIDALRLGADDFLQKPFETDELLFRMSNCFDKQDMQKKIALYEDILPVCCYCKKIRDDREEDRGHGQWYSLEEYLGKVQGLSVSHGCCPDCYAKHMQRFLPGQDKGPAAPKKK